MNNRTLIGIIDTVIDGYHIQGLVGLIDEPRPLTGIISRVIETVDPVIQPLEVTENGEYSAPENVHGFNPVKVDVPLKYDEGYTDGYQASQDSIKLQEKTATENGEVVTDEGFTGMSKVIVAVPIKEEQEKTVDITANGTVEIVPDEGKTLSKVTANVNVASTGEVGKPYIDSSKMNCFYRFFYYGVNLDVLASIDTSNGTDFSEMFRGCSELTTVPQLDTSNGINFSYMFNTCSALQTIPQLDTSKGTNLSNMFWGCSSLTAIPQLDTGNSTKFGGMFRTCSKLTTVPQLDTSNGTEFSYMFYECFALTTAPQLDTSKGTSFSNMFYKCLTLTTVPLLDISNGTSFGSMFANCYDLETVSFTASKQGHGFSANSFTNCGSLANITIGEGWAGGIYLHTTSSLTVKSLHGMIENLADKTGQTAGTFRVGPTNLEKIDEEHIDMLIAKNWTYS